MTSSTYEYFQRTYRPELKAAGRFFCCGCLVHRPVDDKSADPRYCQGCYEFLSIEASRLSRKAGKPDWVPRNDTAPGKCAKTPKEKHTLKTPPMTVFAQPDNDGAKPEVNSGGRPAKDLPVEKINEMFASGMKVTEIVRQLGTDGLEVSRRSLYYIKTGQRGRNA